MVSSLLIDIGLIILFAAFLALIVKFFRQPLVLGYVLAGILIGPLAFGLITNAELTTQPSCLNLLISSSKPTMKRRKATPNSASCFISSALVIRPNANGPIKMPARTYHNTNGCLKNFTIKAKKAANNIINPISINNELTIKPLFY